MTRSKRKAGLVPSAGFAGRILVSAQMGIGNAILFLPFLRALRSGYPRAHIAAVFSEPNGADEVLRSLAPGVVDEIVQLALRGRGKAARIWSGVRLGARGWPMVIIRFSGSRAEILTAAAVGRARWRVGHTTSEDWHNRWSSFLNVPVTMRPSTHEVDRYLQLADALGIAWSERIPRVDVGRGAIDAVRRKLPVLFSPRSPWVLLAPGSSPAQAWKRWPEDLWSALAAKLAAAGIMPVFAGAASEHSLIEGIVAEASTALAVNAAGRLSLEESAALAAAAQTLVCPDSALMHIAAAVGTPVIALFGPTDDTRTGPIGAGHEILRSSECQGGCYSLADPEGHRFCNVERCMRGISVERVFVAVEARLRAPARAPGEVTPGVGH